MAKRRVFAPYTKAQARKIVHDYFMLSGKDTDMEVERLEACAIRDGLDVGKYLYDWQNKWASGYRGNIRELQILYPYYSSQFGCSEV